MTDPETDGCRRECDLDHGGGGVQVLCHHRKCRQIKIHRERTQRSERAEDHDEHHRMQRTTRTTASRLAVDLSPYDGSEAEARESDI